MNQTKKKTYPIIANPGKLLTPRIPKKHNRKLTLSRYKKLFGIQKSAYIPLQISHKSKFIKRLAELSGIAVKKITPFVKSLSLTYKTEAGEEKPLLISPVQFRALYTQSVKAAIINTINNEK